MPQNFLCLECVEIRDVDIGECSILAHGYVGEKMGKCPICGRENLKKGRRASKYHDVPMGLKTVQVNIVRTKYTCLDCGWKYIADHTNEFDEKRKCTIRLVETIKKRCLAIPFGDLADYTGLDIATIKSIAFEYTKKIEDTVKFETPKVMAINKLMIADQTRYVISNVEKGSLFNVLDAKLDSTLKNYLKKLPARKEVKWVFEDLKIPLRELLYDSFPSCKAVVHQKKVEELLYECLAKECYLRQIILDSKQKGLTEKIVKVLTVKKKSNLTASDKKDLAELAKTCPALANCFNYKEDFLAIYGIRNQTSAKFAMGLWCETIPQELALITHFSQIVRNSLIEIMAYWEVPKSIKQAYLDCYDGLREICSYVGNTDNYRIVRARLLYDEDARQSNMIESVVGGTLEYGASIQKLRERIS